jgi:hypothetical protein
MLNGWNGLIRIKTMTALDRCAAAFNTWTGSPITHPNGINLKTFTDDFRVLSEYHKQIQSFGFGDITQCTNDLETKKEPQYVRLYIVPDNVEFNENHIHYNFSVIVMDKVEDDLSNQPEVMSDTLAIMMDLWTVFYQSYTYESGDFSNIIIGDWGPEVHPFLERFQTNLGGWVPYCINYLDSPATTSATTYTIYYLNSSGATSYWGGDGQLTSFTALEISA